MWGTGGYADCVLSNSNIYDNIIGFIDTKKDIDFYRGKKVFDILDLSSIEYDYIIVASRYIDDIQKEIINEHIPEDNIIYLQRTWLQYDNGNINFDNVSSSYEEDKVLFKNFGEFKSFPLHQNAIFSITAVKGTQDFEQNFLINCSHVVEFGSISSIMISPLSTSPAL